MWSVSDSILEIQPEIKASTLKVYKNNIIKMYSLINFDEPITQITIKDIVYKFDKLKEVLESNGLKIGNVLRRPIDGLIEFHVLN